MDPSFPSAPGSERMPWDMLTGSRLNVSGKPADPELQLIQREMQKVELVRDRSDLEHFLATLAAKHGGPYETLDLIAHSDGRDRLLRLGTWLIGDEAETDRFVANVEPSVQKLGIRQLRLLGCYTACRPAGQSTIRRLAHGLGFNVYGAYSVLNQFCYDEKGINSYGEESLACQQSFVQCVEADSVGRRLGARVSLAGLRPESVTAARRAQVVLDRRQFAGVRALIEGEEAHTAPGLQMLPDATLLAPSDTVGLHHRMEVLDDWKLVRVYPSGQPHGVIARVKDPERLKVLAARSGTRE